jgi:ABC-2 type transport system permease protein
MGLSGIAVGLGAWMPDLRESSPSKISSGFGGTLSLVISSLFIMATVIAAAVPTHLFLLTHTLGPSVISSHGILAWAGGRWGAIAGGLAVVGLGIAATVVPLMLGLRAFRRLEA